METPLGKRDWIVEATCLDRRGRTGGSWSSRSRSASGHEGQLRLDFDDGDALVAETLAHWEREFTDVPIAQVEGIADPLEGSPRWSTA